MVLLKDLPEWILVGEQVKVFKEIEDSSGSDSVEHLDINEYLIKEDDSISNLEEFKRVLDICRYWGIPFTHSMYNYTLVDEFEVLRYLFTFCDQLEIKEFIIMILDEPIIKISRQPKWSILLGEVVCGGYRVILETKHNSHNLEFNISKLSEICENIVSALRNKDEIITIPYDDFRNIKFHGDHIECRNSSSVNVIVIFKINRNRYMLIDFFEKLSKNRDIPQYPLIETLGN